MRKVKKTIYHFPVLLEEIASLCLEAEKELFKEEVKQNQFVGLHELEFAY